MSRHKRGRKNGNTLKTLTMHNTQFVMTRPRPIHRPADKWINVLTGYGKKQNSVNFFFLCATCPKEGVRFSHVIFPICSVQSPWEEY